MNEEELNMQIRRFLKKVGIQSQREIEQAVREAVDAGKLQPGQACSARMRLQIEELGLDTSIEGEIKL